MLSNNEKICHKISEDKIAVSKKTAGLRSGNFSDLNSAFYKVSVPVKIFQLQVSTYIVNIKKEYKNSLK